MKNFLRSLLYVGVAALASFAVIPSAAAQDGSGMNQLSWLLYWADTLPSLATGIGAVATVGSIAAAITLVVHVVTGGFAKAGDPDAKAAHEATRFARWLAPLMIVLGLSSHLVPEKETFYLIAGSEMGETAINTPEFQKIRKVVNTYLDEALPKEEKEKEKAE